MNDWLAIAPHAQPVCSFVGARTSITDFSDRPPRILDVDERIETGSHIFRVIETKHVPHGWDASLLFEETASTLFCSDLVGQGGDVEALTEGDIVGRSQDYNEHQAAGPMSRAVPFTDETLPIIENLAALRPKTLACMHGSSFAGNGGQVLLDFGAMLKRLNARNNTEY